jgi:hypothetical protein
MFYFEVYLGITGYFLYSKTAEAKRQLEVIKKLNFSLNLG